LLEGIGINLGYLLVHTLNFLMMVLILSALVYRPVQAALDNRRQRIAKGLEDARVAAEARENAEREASQIINDAQARSSQILREATERADAAARDVRAQAEVEAEREREIAMAEIQQERERILSDLRGQVASLSLAVAQKIIGESLDEKRQHALIDEFFSGIRGGRVTVLEDLSMNGGASAEVVSALPLSADEKETVKRDLLDKMGAQATVTFRVDPSILGGLVVRVGDKVWDASIAGKLDGLRQSLA
jgi:F-type H+-transporting ATPase subunit b